MIDGWVEAKRDACLSGDVQNAKTRDSVKIERQLHPRSRMEGAKLHIVALLEPNGIVFNVHHLAIASESFALPLIPLGRRDQRPFIRMIRPE